MDIYRALIGDPPTDEEKLQAIAKALRARSNLGLAGQLTGDRVMAPVGQQMAEASDLQAQQLGVRGESARYRRYQEAASQRAAELNAREQAWKEADAIAQRKHELQLEGMREGTMRDIASMKAKPSSLDPKVLATFTERFSKELEKAGIPELETNMAEADAILAPYMDPKSSIPGIGPADFSSYMLGKRGDKARSIEQSMQAAWNVLIKARSGAAVTPPEFERLKKEMFGPMATEKGFRQGWETLKSAVAAKRLNIESGYDPEVISNYDYNQSLRKKGAGKKNVVEVDE